MIFIRIKSIFTGLLTLFSCIIFAGDVSANECKPKLYEFDNESKPLNMFFIAKNNNANTAFYDINLTKNGLINAKEPLTAFWLMLAEKGQREDISYIERKLAFGVNSVKAIVPGHEYTARIASMDRDIIIRYDNGCGMVETPINGKLSRLEKIMLELKGPTYFSTLIYMDIYGQDLETGAPVVERWYYNK